LNCLKFHVYKTDYKLNMKIKLDHVFFVVINLIIFFVFKSRAFLVASLFTFVLLTPLKFKKYYYFFFIFIFIALVKFYKYDSSLGRILIYKISSKIFVNSWPFGIGEGKFKREYLLEQAQYFSELNYSKSEFLLADNTIFAFNDWFQSICEHGVLAIIIIALFVNILFKLYPKFHNKFWSKYYLLTILIMACFTHVFEREYVNYLVLLIFFYLFYELISNRFCKKFIFISSLFVVILGVISELKLIKQNYFLEKGIKEANTGNLFRSNVTFQYMLEENICNEECLFYYSRNCYLRGDYKESIKHLNILLNHNSNSLYYSLYADCLLAENKFRESEKYFVNSINMVPNRFEERFKLLNLYLVTNQFKKAKEIANFIIDMPIKVSTERVIYIKKFCSEIISE